MKGVLLGRHLERLVLCGKHLNKSDDTGFRLHIKRSGFTRGFSRATVLPNVSVELRHTVKNAEAFGKKFRQE
jgi:hypothetical protein